MITTEQIKELRDLTGVSVMQCKKALEETGGDKEKALLILRKKSAGIAEKKGDRELGAGVVDAYIHSNKTVGTLIELSCETDFVARNEEFIALARDIAMQVTATNPAYIDESEITEEVRAKVIEMFKKEVEESGKPADIQAKMMDGKLATYFAERTLLGQAFIKNPDITIKQLIDGGVQKFGEKIVVSRFSRFSVAR
jgi:elongation factor Ts